jgi:hypothetical protein
MTAAISVERQFERKPLLGSQPRMIAHECEVAERLAREQAQKFIDVILRVLTQFRQDMWIPGI